MTNVITHTDANGVTREYRQVKRKANVGELVMRTTDGHIYRKGEVFTVVSVNIHGDVTKAGADTRLFPQNYVVLEPTDVVVHDGKRYRAVNRKANVGEKVMIVSNAFPSNYDIGEVFTVNDSKPETRYELAGIYITALVGRRNQNRPGFVQDGKYVVLEPLTDASQSQPTTAPPTDSRVAQLEERVLALSERVESLEKRLGGDTIREHLVSALRKHQPAPRKLSRDEIVAKAKADVETLVQTVGSDNWRTSGIPAHYEHGALSVKFDVNRDQRCVTALTRWKHVGGEFGATGRATAQCAPDHVFNVHIGKAIALRRALGLDVPTQYTNVPQPTDVRVGDVFEITMFLGDKYISAAANEQVACAWTRYLSEGRRGYKFYDDSGRYDA